MFVFSLTDSLRGKMFDMIFNPARKGSRNNYASMDGSSQNPPYDYIEGTYID